MVSISDSYHREPIYTTPMSSTKETPLEAGHLEARKRHSQPMERFTDMIGLSVGPLLRMAVYYSIGLLQTTVFVIATWSSYCTYGSGDNHQAASMMDSLKIVNAKLLKLLSQRKSAREQRYNLNSLRTSEHICFNCRNQRPNLTHARPHPINRYADTSPLSRHVSKLLQFKLQETQKRKSSRLCHLRPNSLCRSYKRATRISSVPPNHSKL